jgi:hypothetical protein
MKRTAIAAGKCYRGGKRGDVRKVTELSGGYLRWFGETSDLLGNYTIEPSQGECLIETFARWAKDEVPEPDALMHAYREYQERRLETRRALGLET